MTDRKLVEFENTYLQGTEGLSSCENESDVSGAVACITIDGYPKETDGGENDAGRTVCVVWLTTDGKFIVDWHENGCRGNEKVRELIEDSKAKLLEVFSDWREDAAK